MILSPLQLNNKVEIKEETKRLEPIKTVFPSPVTSMTKTYNSKFKINDGQYKNLKSKRPKAPKFNIKMKIPREIYKLIEDKKSPK